MTWGDLTAPLSQTRPTQAGHPIKPGQVRADLCRCETHLLRAAPVCQRGWHACAIRQVGVVTGDEEGHARRGWGCACAGCLQWRQLALRGERFGWDFRQRPAVGKPVGEGGGTRKGAGSLLAPSLALKCGLPRA